MDPGAGVRVDGREPDAVAGPVPEGIAQAAAASTSRAARSTARAGTPGAIAASAARRASSTASNSSRTRSSAGPVWYVRVMSVQKPSTNELQCTMTASPERIRRLRVRAYER